MREIINFLFCYTYLIILLKRQDVKKDSWCNSIEAYLDPGMQKLKTTKSVFVHYRY